MTIEYASETQVNRAPKNDSTHRKVEAAGPVTLVLEAGIAHFAQTVEKHCFGQRILCLAFVQANVQAPPQRGILQLKQRFIGLNIIERSMITREEFGRPKLAALRPKRLNLAKGLRIVARQLGQRIRQLDQQLTCVSYLDVYYCELNEGRGVAALSIDQRSRCRPG
jgi:hypothetical protein